MDFVNPEFAFWLDFKCKVACGNWAQSPLSLPSSKLPRGSFLSLRARRIETGAREGMSIFHEHHRPHYPIYSAIYCAKFPDPKRPFSGSKWRL